MNCRDANQNRKPHGYLDGPQTFDSHGRTATFLRPTWTLERELPTSDSEKGWGKCSGQGQGQPGAADSDERRTDKGRSDTLRDGRKTAGNGEGQRDRHVLKELLTGSSDACSRMADARVPLLRTVSAKRPLATIPAVLSPIQPPEAMLRVRHVRIRTPPPDLQMPGTRNGRRCRSALPRTPSDRSRRPTRKSVASRSDVPRAANAGGRFAVEVARDVCWGRRSSRTTELAPTTHRTANAEIEQRRTATAGVLCGMEDRQRSSRQGSEETRARPSSANESPVVEVVNERRADGRTEKAPSGCKECSRREEATARREFGTATSQHRSETGTWTNLRRNSAAKEGRTGREEETSTRSAELGQLASKDQ